MKARNQEDLDAEVAESLVHLAQLKKSLGPENRTLASISVTELRNSRSLRTSLKEYKEIYFF